MTFPFIEYDGLVLESEQIPEAARAGAPGQPVQGDRFIHIKVSDSGGMDRIRTKRFSGGVLARIGWKDGKSRVVSLLFDKSKFNAGEARKWWKAHRNSLASIDIATGSVYVEPELLDVDPAYGFEVPKATPSKAYAVFRLLSFYPVVNQRHDAFDAADVDDAAADTVKGSPIYGNQDLTDHFERSGTRGPRVGTVLDAIRREDGIYALAVIEKDILEQDYGISAAELPQGYSVSMEVRFDPDEVRYLVDGRILHRNEAVATGVAAPTPAADNPRKYDARFLVPIEYHAVALLHRGRNADPTADVLLTAASKEHKEKNPMPEIQEIEWHEDDHAAFIEFTESIAADMTSKERKKLPKGQFAYVDPDGKGHLPIHDEAHVRNALARLNQTQIPESAKRSALRKILAAARRFGIRVDPKSPVVKAYGANHTPEERERMLKMLRARKQKGKTGDMMMAAVDPHPIETQGLSVLFSEDGVLYRAEFDVNDQDEFVLLDTEELGPITTAKESTMDEKQIQEALAKAREEAANAKAAELEAAFKTREPDLAKAAVEQFRNSDEFKNLIDEAKAAAVTEYTRTRETIANRTKELEAVHPFKDEAERQAVEAKVAGTVGNDTEWFRLKAERLEATLASVTRKSKPINPAPAPTLTAKASADKRNIFDFTEE